MTFCHSSDKLKITKQNMNYKAKMDPEKASTPVKKLIEAAKYDLIDRMCIRQYIEESSATLGKESKY